MSGLVAVDELKVVNDLSDESLSCRRSTALYPDVSLMGFSWTDPSLLRDVTVALLAQKAEGDDEWISFVPHASVDALFRDLRAGPYRYLRDTSLAGIYERHSLAFQLAGAALLSLILYGILLQVLVRRRTRNSPARLPNRGAWKRRPASTVDASETSSGATSSIRCRA